jgi:hypothetical protein
LDHLAALFTRLCCIEALFTRLTWMALPCTQIAILFSYMGQSGVNVIRPRYSPRLVFERVAGKN